jgi:hypothetical protein
MWNGISLFQKWSNCSTQLAANHFVGHLRLGFNVNGRRKVFCENENENENERSKNTIAI